MRSDVAPGVAPKERLESPNAIDNRHTIPLLFINAPRVSISGCRFWVFRTYLTFDQASCLEGCTADIHLTNTSGQEGRRRADRRRRQLYKTLTNNGLSGSYRKLSA